MQHREVVVWKTTATYILKFPVLMAVENADAVRKFILYIMFSVFITLKFEFYWF